MTDRTTDFSQAEEAELLLPWYVSGNIAEPDRQKVEAWLSENPGAQAHLERAREEMDLTLADAEARGTPSRAGFNKLMAQVERTAARPAATPAASWIDRIWAMLSPRYALAGVAGLCLLVLAQGAALTIMSQSDPTGTAGDFELATGSSPAVAGPTALVAFAQNTQIAEISTLLAAHNLAILDGPRAGGIYLISAPDTEAGAAALADLAGSDLVTFHSPRDQEE